MVWPYCLFLSNMNFPQPLIKRGGGAKAPASNFTLCYSVVANSYHSLFIVITTHPQFWFDDPQSLSLKYSMAAQHSLKGLAFWNVDSLDYSDEPRGHKDTQEMWTAIDAFFSN